MRYVQWSLGHAFEFVFLDAPWESGPGPGVNPVFQEMGPYFRWAVPDGYVPSKNEPAPSSLEQRLRSVLQSDGGEWIGVLGFSQGGKLAAGMMRECEEGLLDGMLPPGQRFKFGLLAGASYPPLYATQKANELWRHPQPRPIQMTPSRTGGGNGGLMEHRTLWDDTLAGAIRTPSIHVQGLDDPVLDMSKMLFRCFDERTRKVFLFDIGHYLPKEKEDNRLVAEAVFDAYMGDWGVPRGRESDDARVGPPSIKHFRSGLGRTRAGPSWELAIE